MVPFGDLSASGSVSPSDANGAQRIELALARKAATKLPDDPKSGRYEFEAMFAFDARGTIAMQRTVDARRGLVTGFRGGRMQEITGLNSTAGKTHHAAMQVVAG